MRGAGILRRSLGHHTTISQARIEDGWIYLVNNSGKDSVLQNPLVVRVDKWDILDGNLGRLNMAVLHRSNIAEQLTLFIILVQLLHSLMTMCMVILKYTET